MTMAFHITMAFHTREFPQPRSALFFTEDVIQHPTLCTLMSFNMIDHLANFSYYCCLIVSHVNSLSVCGGHHMNFSESSSETSTM
ncbi:hypothetical protein M8J77_025000 [Diaphorina citri]|nr:hypothetical protein M8J77_025000 [Diaphorina citri]